jgi:hypothetical protein
MLTDAFERLQKRTKANNVDVSRIFAPVFDSIVAAANGGSDVVAQRLAAWGPADVTTASLRALVQDIVTAVAPAVDLAAMQRHQEELEAEMAQIIRPERPAISYQ